MTKPVDFNFSTKLLQWCSNFPLSETERPTWDEYFLLVAFMVSRRSSCLRRKVGAVIVKDKDIISTGYNGAPTPQKNCIEIGNCYRDQHGIKSVLNWNAVELQDHMQNQMQLL